MKTLRTFPALLLALSALRAAPAQQPAPPRMGGAPAPDSAAPDPAPLPFCRLDPHDPERLAVEPCRKAPSQPRRSVAQVVQRMPAPGKTLVYGHPAPLPPGLSAALPGAAAPPPVLTGCDPGGCRDAGGQRYNGYVGNAAGNGAGISGSGILFDSRGRPCARNGLLIQCF